MAHIVLDTNVLHRDYTLEGAWLRVVADAKRTGDVVAIPAVVIDEFCNQFREAAESDLHKLTHARLGLVRLGFEVAPPPVFEIEKSVQQFRDVARKKLANLGIEELPYPAVEHRTLVARDLRRRKPFAESGKGYRDALIWESVIALAKDRGKVILVTKNKSDFGTPLHPDLVSDLRVAQLPDDHVAVEDTLDSLIAKHLRPSLALVDEAATQLRCGTFPHLDLAAWTTSHALDLLSGSEFDAREAGFSSRHQQPLATRATDVKPPAVLEVRRLPSGALLVESEVLVTAEFEAVFVSSKAGELPLVARPRDYESGTSDIFLEGTWAEVKLRFLVVVEADGNVSSWQRVSLVGTGNREFPEGLDYETWGRRS